MNQQIEPEEVSKDNPAWTLVVIIVVAIAINGVVFTNRYYDFRKTEVESKRPQIIVTNIINRIQQ